MAYTPQHGSVPWKVIEFLTTNPEEELARAGKRLPALDLDAIQIETGVPIAKGRTPAIDFMPLFNRMKPGESCAIHSAFKYVLGKACGKFKKAELGEMSIRKINDDELRLWKIK